MYREKFWTRRLQGTAWLGIWWGHMQSEIQKTFQGCHTYRRDQIFRSTKSFVLRTKQVGQLNKMHKITTV